jgi:hypothetical protein
MKKSELKQLRILTKEIHELKKIRPPVLPMEWCIVRCADCDMEMFIPMEFNERRRKDAKTFYCLAGHKNYYPK